MWTQDLQSVFPDLGMDLKSESNITITVLHNCCRGITAGRGRVAPRGSLNIAGFAAPGRVALLSVSG